MKRTSPSRIYDLAPLAGAALCILVIGILALTCPKQPRQTSLEEAAATQLERKIVRQALAVQYAAERFRRKTLFPVFE